MPRDIGEWLVRLGLGGYREVFAEHDIGFDVLPRLTEEHLKEIGIPLGDRLRLLKAIEALETPQPDPLEIPLPPQADTSLAVPIGEAERRQLTILF